MTLWLTLLWGVLCALADDECPDTDGWLDGEAHLRAMSLDLRGVVPGAGEVELVDGEVPADVIDEWLASEAFADRAARFHRTLLWNNVGNIRALDNRVLLGARSGVWWARIRSTLYRGEFDAHCGTFPATFDAQGAVVPVPQPDGTVQEGWVWVSPFWDPDTPIQVCAYDAAEVRYSPSDTDCTTHAAFQDAGCGCGPDLQWCAPTSQHIRVMEDFGEDIDRRVARNVLDNRSWLDLLTGSRGFVNGRIVSFLEHRAGVTQGVRFDIPGVAPAALPDLDFTDGDDWVEVSFGDQHSGVFTSPAFLLRFQTGRARANQFYDGFLCQPFQPPDGGLPDVDTPRPTLDLTARDGCRYCHALLEPAAAHWGRWTPFGAGYLDEAAFPAYDPSCAECATGLVDCSETCSRYYLTRSLSPEQDPYLGWLQAYQFLETRHEPNVELGPSFLVEQGLADGRIAECAATKAATWLLGRPPTLEEGPWIEDLAQGFVQSDYRWRELVKAIVTSGPYRSVQ